MRGIPKEGDAHPLPSHIQFYIEGDLSGINLESLKGYLQEKTGIPVLGGGNVYQSLSPDRIEILARKFAGIRIKNPKRPLPKTVFEVEVQYEMDRMRDPGWQLYGIPYEGALYQQLIHDLVFEGRLSEEECTILFTNQLIATWDPDDWHFHIRISLYGFPHLISIPGIVSGPARPREYYVKKQKGIPIEWLKEEYKGKFIDHGDPRMTEVLKGYVLQAFMYNLEGDPFCDDPDCRLFNSHWQEEMIHAQLDGAYEFCPRHEEVLRQVKTGIKGWNLNTSLNGEGAA
ncbi:MAG: hypothetical protein N3G78_11145 [Desulfobacterota bacterium]|nr:hypothetical protein [Thermodesulfobacteriota bacterium]